MAGEKYQYHWDEVCCNMKIISDKDLLCVKNSYNRYHQMTSFNLRLHQNLCWLGVHPRSHYRSLQHSLQPLADFNGCGMKGIRREGKLEGGGNKGADKG